MTLSEYYKTEKWKEISKKRMEIDGFKCCMCGAEGTTANWLEVHHFSYAYLFKEEQRIYEDLATVCASCHAQVHRLMNRITSESGRRGWLDNPNIPPTVHVFNTGAGIATYEEEV